MKRFKSDAGSLPTLHTTIPPLVAEHESKLRGGFVAVDSVSATSSLNLNLIKCSCTTNKSCPTVLVTSTPEKTTTPRGTQSANAVFAGLF